MPITYFIDTAAGIVNLRSAGEPTAKDFAVAMQEVFEHSDYRPGMNFISDRREAGPMSKDYIRGAISFVGRHTDKLAGSRWALVVGPHPVEYGIARMGDMLAHEIPVPRGIFTSIEDALAWLKG